jgi:N-methylhydantoinase A/oxoprolinase/acetone carboxylase beta subunit
MDGARFHRGGDKMGTSGRHQCGLLERMGEPLALAITAGFGDALRNGTRLAAGTFSRAGSSFPTAL